MKKNSKSESKGRRNPSSGKNQKAMEELRKIEREKSPFVRRKKNISRKKRPGERVLQEIRRLQVATDFIIPRHPFSRLLKEVCVEQCGCTFRWTREAIDAIQGAT